MSKGAALLQAAEEAGEVGNDADDSSDSSAMGSVDADSDLDISVDAAAAHSDVEEELDEDVFDDEASDLGGDEGTAAAAAAAEEQDASGAERGAEAKYSAETADGLDSDDELGNEENDELASDGPSAAPFNSELDGADGKAQLLPGLRRGKLLSTKRLSDAQNDIDEDTSDEGAAAQRSAKRRKAGPISSDR